MRELEKVLDKNEKVLWEGRPSWIPYLLGPLLPFFILEIIWLLLTLTIILYFNKYLSLEFYTKTLFPFLSINVLLIICPTVYFFLTYKHTHYALTDKRVIFQKGIIGRDFRSIELDKITEINVDVGFTDKIYGQDTGSVVIKTGASSTITGHLISHIPHPYDVFKLIKKVAHDIKTDIHYPNKLRPAENPGYGTTYTGDTK